MALSITYYLRYPKEQKSGIYAKISWNGYHFKKYTPYRISTSAWNWCNKKKKFKNRALSKEQRDVAEYLGSFSERINTLYQKYLKDHNHIIPSPETLKYILSKGLNKTEDSEESNEFMAQFERIISDSQRGKRRTAKQSRIAPNTLKSYVTSYNKLLQYEKDSGLKITYQRVDLDFYHNYTSYLSNLGLSDNSIGKEVKNIKMVMRETLELGLHQNLLFKSKTFAVNKKAKEQIYLRETELNSLEKLDLAKKPCLDRVRDLFLIGCYTGLRFSDYSRISKSNITEDNKFIQIKQTKTKEPIAIPISAKAKIILEKYDYNLPSISNQKTNDYLKEIGKQIPQLNELFSRHIELEGKETIDEIERYKVLTTHTARRTFATLEYIKETPTKTIMAITGHKTERSFMKYICTTQKDEAKRLMKIWEKRNNQ